MRVKIKMGKGWMGLLDIRGCRREGNRADLRDRMVFTVEGKVNPK